MLLFHSIRILLLYLDFALRCADYGNERMMCADCEEWQGLRGSKAPTAKPRVKEEDTMWVQRGHQQCETNATQIANAAAAIGPEPCLGAGKEKRQREGGDHISSKAIIIFCVERAHCFRNNVILWVICFRCELFCYLFYISLILKGALFAIWNSVSIHNRHLISFEVLHMDL